MINSVQTKPNNRPFSLAFWSAAALCRFPIKRVKLTHQSHFNKKMETGITDHVWSLEKIVNLLA